MDNFGWMSLLSTTIGAVLLFAGTFITVIAGRKNSQDDRSISIQEQQDRRIESLEKAMAAEQRHRRILEDYVYSLRNHIDQRKPPPPPEYPQELRNG